MSRIYLVTSPSRVRLIKAQTPAQAIRFAVGTDYAARVASQDDMVDHLAASPVEDATKTPVAAAALAEPTSADEG